MFFLISMDITNTWIEVTGPMAVPYNQALLYFIQQSFNEILNNKNTNI